MRDTYYTDRLYPLQDQVLKLLSPAISIFYLTGGTALSRHYFHHRYSDDLDFFSNQDPEFKNQTELAINTLKDRFEIRLQSVSARYVLLYVSFEGLELKIDFVDDVPYRVDSPVQTPLFSKTDNWKNILSNKLTALQREAAKDIADIIFLCRNFSFSWPEMIGHAGMKDMWVNELEISKYIDQYNFDELSTVKWIESPDLNEFSSILKQISKDIVLGANNSLVKK